MSTFENNIFNMYQEKGKSWLLDLPKMVKEISVIWELSNLKPVPNLTFNYVLSGFQASRPIILKLSLDNNGLAQEVFALNAFSTFGAIKVIAHQPGALLLEHAIPGISLRSYFPARELEALKITCDVIQKLQQAPIPHHPFPHISDWLSILDENPRIPLGYLKKARNVRDSLLNSTTKPIILHGDLHHDNILQKGEEWVVIDPKGVIGELVYEVAAFIRNPLPKLLDATDPLNIILNRITYFSKTLNMDASRIKEWCFVQIILAWMWALEDGGNTNDFMKLAAIFDKICINQSDHNA